MNWSRRIPNLLLASARPVPNQQIRLSLTPLLISFQFIGCKMDITTILSLTPKVVVCFVYTAVIITENAIHHLKKKNATKSRENKQIIHQIDGD